MPLSRNRMIHFDSNRENSKSRTNEKGHEELVFKTLDKIREVGNA